MSTRLDFIDLDNVRSKFLKVTYPTATSEVYTWRKTDVNSPIVLQLTIVYTSSSKEEVDTVTVNTPNQVA